jgi:hypothetical protein
MKFEIVHDHIDETPGTFIIVHEGYPLLLRVTDLSDLDANAEIETKTKAVNYVTFEVANKYFMITLEETTGQEPPFNVDSDQEIREYLAARMFKAADFFQEQTLAQAQ